ncbi:alpha-(1-_3)-arabinofuranosyltransferase [Parafrankia sp. EAN1pec]|uniref:alpha-(1->3)-arabinofuranosyltransferase n=1 Tax=Parafrankia sp. (strain EAN1pec) TaxID=298653 RepID=UPI0000543213
MYEGRANPDYRLEPPISSSPAGHAVRPGPTDPAADHTSAGAPARGLRGAGRSRSDRPRAAPGRASRRPLLAMFAGFVLLFLLQAPGKLTADTKLDVPLEPWRFMSAATHLWNSTSDFGFLPNQYAGYLFPMGPFFGLGNLLGVPPWITQRLWMAVLLTTAAWGTVRLAEALGIGRPSARFLAGLSYALSPMFLGKVGATSVAMVGAAMLPWITLPLILALRPDGAGGADTGHRDDTGERARELAAARLSPRRAAALSGLAVLCTGGINATVTLCVLLCPAVVLVFAGATRRAWALRAWWCVCVVLACAWWMLALAVQGRYGLNFLPFTETADTTTGTTSVGETLRGAADWMAYLSLPTPWLPAAQEYVSTPLAVVASAVVSAFGLAGLVRRDLPARRFLLVTLAVGVVSVAAAYPGQPGSPLADGVRSLLTEPFGFLRNVYKFQPVVRLPLTLGLAHLLGVALSWRPGAVRAGAAGPPEDAGPAGRARRGAEGAGDDRRRLVPVLVILVTVGTLVAGMAPMLRGQGLQPRPFTKVPDYWAQAADWLADHPEGGRALVLPGAPFGEYQWGRPLDEPLQWLARTPWGVRNIIPLGGVGTTRLMDGIEHMMATGSTPGLGVTLARAGVGQVLVRNDIEQKDWDIPPSTDQLHRSLESSGLVRAASFGPEVQARTAAKARLVESLSESAEKVPAIEIWTVPGGASMVQAYPVDTGVVVSGGPEATVQLAGQGLLSADRAVVLAGDLAEPDRPAGGAAAGAADDTAITRAPIADPPPASQVVTPTTAWAVTDTNTRRGYTFGIVHDSASYLLGPDETVAGRPGPPSQWVDRPVVGHQTVAGYADGMSVQASSYGYDLLAAPDFAPSAAVDGQTSTSWTALRRQGATSQGQWIQLDVGREMSVPYIDIRLLQEGDWRPEVEALRVTTERGSAVTQVSPIEDIQRLAVPPGMSRWYRITFDKVSRETDPVLGAGLREIEIPGVRFQRYAQAPADMVDEFQAPDEGLVAYSFERTRVDPLQPFGGSEEITLSRRFEVPRRLTFTLTGTASALPPPAGAEVDSSDDPLVIPCGQGPALTIDGVRHDIQVEGKYSDLATARPFRISLCSEGHQITLDPGQHLITVDLGQSTMLVDSLSLVGTTAATSTEKPRTTRIGEWGAERRTIEIGAGARSFVSVRENANASWTATLDGKPLTAVRLDGWAQGWIVPAGAAGTIVIENLPGQEYRRNLIIGLALVVLLIVLAAVPGRHRLRRRSDPDGYPLGLEPGRVPLIGLLTRVPGAWAGMALATAAVFLIAGWLALAVPVLVLVGRRFPVVLGVLAVAGMVGSGIAVAVSPDSIPFSGEGAFGWQAQTLGSLAFAATVAALALRRAEPARPASPGPASDGSAGHVP